MTYEEQVLKMAKSEAEKILRLMKEQQQGPGIEAGAGNAKRSAIVCVDILIQAEEMYTNGAPEPAKYYTKVKEELLKL